MSEEEAQRIELPIVLAGEHDDPIIFVNWANVSHEGSEFVLTLGQITQPITLGGPEQRAEQAKRIGAVPIKVVGRFGIPASRMMAIVRAMSENLQKYETRKGLDDDVGS